MWLAHFYDIYIYIYYYIATAAEQSPKQIIMLKGQSKYVLSYLYLWGHWHYKQDAMVSTRTSDGEEAAQTASLVDRWTPDHQQHGGAPSC